jgi:hypothetical protein
MTPSSRSSECLQLNYSNVLLLNLIIPMAKLIPHTDPSQITFEPERVVAEALCSQLPSKAVIFHSYPWLRQERDHYKTGAQPVLREGETDFVVLHPRYGILVIEVKGGHLTFDQQTTQWKRAGGTHRVKDPFDQAARNMHALEEVLKNRSFFNYEKLPFARVRCVIFPNCDFQGTLPPGADKSLIFTASDLGKLGAKIEALFKLQPFVPASDLSREVLDGITRALTSTFQLVPALWSEIEEQEKKLFRFTESQLNLLTFMTSHSRAAIQGVAGSGKTLLAIAKARAFADEGKKVLFVCFNEMLAEWLRSELPESYRNSITIRNYHKLCHEWVKKAGLVWPQVADQAVFFAQEAPALLERAIDLLPDFCFDAVVVDEGQDFVPAWWDTVELINKRPTEGPLYIFSDPDQQIFFESAPSMPDLGNPFVLPVNCRNTGRIAAKCGKILGKSIPINTDTPEGRAPTVILAPSAELQRNEVETQLKDWFKPVGGLKGSRVAIVTRGNVDKSSMAGVERIAGRPLTQDLSVWRQGGAILLTSLYKFKGLEADALILVDVINPDPQAKPSGFRPGHFYVACSRAKHLLTIIASQKIEGL